MADREHDDRDDWLEGDTWTDEPAEERPPAAPRWVPAWGRRRPIESWNYRRVALAGLAALAVVVLVAVLIARALGDDTEAGSGATTPTTQPAPTETQPPASGAQTLPRGARLELGDEGRQVRRLQRALAGLGYDVGEVDGIFGSGTQDALRSFQRDAGLEADGVLGARTVRALNEALAGSG